MRTGGFFPPMDWKPSWIDPDSLVDPSGSLPRGAALESALFWLSVIINVIFLACDLSPF